MWLIMSSTEKSMTFETVFIAKYQEFSHDFVVNAITVTEQEI